MYVISYYVCKVCRSYSSELTFTIQLRHRSMYVLVNVAIPIVLLNILTLAVFFVPYEERINFCITIFLTFMVLTMVNADKLPESLETIPLLGRLVTYINYYSYN